MTTFPWASINPFPGFNGSIHTDWGDVTGDGVDDIIAGSGSGSPNGHVVVYDGFQLLYGDKGKADLQFVSQGGAVRASLYAFVSYTSGVAVRSIISGSPNQRYSLNSSCE